MKDVYEMTEQEFRELLARKTTPQAVWDNADEEVYEWLSRTLGEDCNDSILREMAFQWAVDGLGLDYEEIYAKWLGE